MLAEQNEAIFTKFIIIGLIFLNVEVMYTKRWQAENGPARSLVQKTGKIVAK